MAAILVVSTSRGEAYRSHDRRRMAAISVRATRPRGGNLPGIRAHRKDTHEYKVDHPDGYAYSQYCPLYRKWAGTLGVWVHQEHKAGEKLFDAVNGLRPPQQTASQTGRP